MEESMSADIAIGFDVTGLAVVVIENEARVVDRVYGTDVSRLHPVVVEVIVKDDDVALAWSPDGTYGKMKDMRDTPETPAQFRRRLAVMCLATHHG